MRVSSGKRACPLFDFQSSNPPEVYRLFSEKKTQINKILPGTGHLDKNLVMELFNLV